MKSLCYHESQLRGSQEFPLDYYYVSIGHPRYEMPYHWHEEVELIHVISGSFSLMLDEAKIVLSAGDVAYIASGRLHGGEPQDCVYECVVFDLRMLMKVGGFARSFLHDVQSRKVDIQPHFVNTPGSASCGLPFVFDALRENADGCDLIACGGLLRFLGEVQRSGACIVNRHPDRESRNVLRLKKVFELIESRPNQPPTLKELAGTVGMCPSAFSRFFRETTHYSPSEYISYYRIEQACYEFVSTDKNVSEVAGNLGYDNLSAFIRCFKRQKGITPGEYIKAIRHQPHQ